MKKQILILVIALLAISNLVTYAQNVAPVKLGCAVWRSNTFTLNSYGPAVNARTVLSLYDDGTFMQYEINRYSNLEQYRFGRYREEPSMLVLVFHDLPYQQDVELSEQIKLKADTLLFGVRYDSSTGDKFFTMAYPVRLDIRRQVAFTKIDNLPCSEKTHKVLSDDGTVKNSDELGNVENILGGKIWQEQAITSTSQVRSVYIFAFNKDKTYLRGSMRYSGGSKKITNFESRQTGTYSINKGFLYLTPEGKTEEDYTLSAFTDSTFTVTENGSARNFVLSGSKSDVFTRNFIIPYVKRITTSNIALEPMLETLSIPYRTVVGKSFVTAIANANTGNETLQFVKDGKIIQDFQLAPAGGLPTKIGIYTETPTEITLTFQNRRTGANEVSVYKIEWKSSSEFELTAKGKKPVLFKAKNQEAE